MAQLLRSMPAVSRHNEVFEDEAPDQEAMAAPTAHVPLYLQRKGFVPRTLAGECVDQCTMLTRGVR